MEGNDCPLGLNGGWGQGRVMGRSGSGGSWEQKVEDAVGLEKALESWRMGS